MCKIEKPLIDFSKNRGARDGLNRYCRTCASIRVRNWKDTHREQYKANRRRTRLVWGNTPHGIYDRLHMNARNGAGGKVLFSSSQFIEWYKSQALICFYCKRKLTFGDRNKDLHGFKGSDKLTIDRKDNSKPYILDNIVLCCRRCNAIKGFRFTHEQLLEIGDKYLYKIDVAGQRPNSKNHIFKLSNDDINQIREFYKSGTPEQQLADLYNVSKSTISNYCRKL